jgi:hypothetical protein
LFFAPRASPRVFDGGQVNHNNNNLININNNNSNNNNNNNNGNNNNNNDNRNNNNDNTPFIIQVYAHAHAHAHQQGSEICTRKYAILWDGKGHCWLEESVVSTGKATGESHGHSIATQLSMANVHTICDMLWAMSRIDGEYKPKQVAVSFYASLSGEEQAKWQDPGADCLAAEDAAAAPRAAATADDDENNEDVPPSPRVAAVPAVMSAAEAAGSAGGGKKPMLLSAVKLITTKLQKLMKNLEDLSVGNDHSTLGARAASLNFPRLEIDNDGKAIFFGFSSVKELSAKSVLGSLLLMTGDVIVKMTLTTVYELDRCAAELRYKMKKNGMPSHPVSSCALRTSFVGLPNARATTEVTCRGPRKPSAPH